MSDRAGPDLGRSARRVWVGVDLGTQSVRALAASDQGAVLGAASRPLGSRRSTGPDGGARHEQDPADWREAVSAALAEVTAGLDDAAVAGIAVDGTSGSVVLVDAAGTPVSPGVMYDDARGAASVERVREAGAELWKRLGHRPGGTWALPTLLAMLPHHPGAARVEHQTDVITRWLVGAPVATDASTALKTGYDVDRLCWPTEMLDALGLDPAVLPAVVLPGTVLGRVGDVAAATTGLPVGVPVIAGMTDGCAAQLGAGAVAPGTWNSVLGTTLVLKGVTDQLLHDPDGTVYCHRGPQGGWWLPGGASSTGAGVLAELIGSSRFDAITGTLRADPPAEVPVTYPLVGHGERFPFAADEAEGFWLDGDRARPLAELVGVVGEVRAFAALCEGVAVVERLCFDHVSALGADVSGARTISGGATRNAWWNQRRADATGAALAVPVTAEPAFGMALLASAAVHADGAEPDLVGAAARMVRIADRYEPRTDPALHDRAAALVEALAARGWA